MAIKSPSDYPLDTTPTATDMFVVEKAGAAGVLERTVRSDVHKLRTGEVIDSSAGVNLLIKSKGTQAITVGSGATTVNNNLVTEGTVICEAVVRLNAGIREQTNLEFYVKGDHRSGVLSGGSTEQWGFVMPAVVNGASLVTPEVNHCVQFSGALTAITFDVVLMAASDGTTYTETIASTTWSNLGEDNGSVLQTALTAARAAFLSGQGVAFTAGDSIYFDNLSSGSLQFLIEVEVVHT